MQNRSTSTRIVVKANQRHINVDINPDGINLEVLKAIDANDTEAFVQNPGLIGLATIVGYSSETVRAASERVRKDTATWQRVNDGVKYMSEVGVGLSSAGRFNGYLLNSLVSEFKPSDLDPRQTSIWGSSKKNTTLISRTMLVAYFAIAAEVSFEFPPELAHYVGEKSASAMLRETASKSGTPDTNTISTLHAMAEAKTLNAEICEAVFATLRCEDAPLKDLPKAAFEAAYAVFGHPAATRPEQRS